MASQTTSITTDAPSHYGATAENKSQADTEGRRVVVLGSTGAIGSRLVLYLAADPSVREVLALTRRTGVFNNPKITETRLSDDGSFDFEGKVDAAFCTIGTTIKKAGSQEAFRKVDYDMAVNFARYVQSHGATEFHLVSSVAASSNSSNFYLRVKGETEDAIRAMNFPYYMVYRPGVLDAEFGRPETRCGENCAVFCFKYFFCCCKCGSCADYQLVSVDDVARVMAYISDRRAVEGPSGAAQASGGATSIRSPLFEDGPHMIEGSGRLLDLAELPGVPNRIE